MSMALVPHVDLSIREAQERWGESLWFTYRGITTFPHYKDETGVYRPVFNDGLQCVGYCKCDVTLPAPTEWSTEDFHVPLWKFMLWAISGGLVRIPHETKQPRPAPRSVPTKQCWSCTCAKGDEPRAFEAAQNVMLGRVTVFEIEPGAEGPDTIRLHFHRVTD